MKKLLFLFFILFSFKNYAQYYSKHYIAPAPWQYWSNSNEIVIGTLSTSTVQITIRKSDGTLITDQLTTTVNNPISYRFVGSSFLASNQPDNTYTDRGIIVEATEPVLVNLRNIDSDTGSNSVANIKGNASLVSFGEEGKGLQFRVGYYRTSTQGLTSNAPVYSVMATEDDTEVNIPSVPNLTITLNEGESRLFTAPIGALLTADKPVVMNTGNWGDTPMTSGINGQDGTFDQIAPVNVLGTKYLIVRGWGAAATASFITNRYGGEQTTIIATEDNTTISIVNYNADGTVNTTNPTTVAIPPTLAAGDSFTFFHGDSTNPLSSSLITTSKPVIVYSGTAVGPETDVSTVLPIGGCAGTVNIQTRKFISYNSTNLPYNAFCIIESVTEPVLVNGVNVETIAGVVPRVPIGNSGFYVINFTNIQIGNPNELVITSILPLTTSIVQSGEGFSMSAFFSSFGEAAQMPMLSSVNEDCTVTLTAEDGYSQYLWFLNGSHIETTNVNQFIVLESGNYSVQVLKTCGLSGISIPLAVDVNPCVDLEVNKETVSQVNLNVTFRITVTNNNPYFTELNTIVTDLLPNGFTYVSSTASAGTYNQTNGNWTVGTLAPNQVETLTINCTINSGGDYINVATVTGDLPDNQLGNNMDSSTIESFTADIDAIKDDNKDFYTVGRELHYTIQVINNGPQKALNVKVSDPMPHTTTEMSWTGNNTSGTGDLVDFIDVLDVNETVTYNVTLRVPKGHFGPFTNTVDVSSENVIDPNPVCTRCEDTNIAEFEIPKGISPNGDGENDYLDLDGYFVSKIAIYNRFGVEVYSKKDYTNQWKGQDKNNKLLSTGTYFYVVEVLGVPYKSGYIYLMREIK